MLEIEMKFRVEAPARYEERLRTLLNVTLGPEAVERDEFFRCDALGFPEEGKTLRVRRRGSYLAATYKGPRLDETTKSREEIELPLIAMSADDPRTRDAQVDQARQNWSIFFERLGFMSAATVEKTRRCGEATFAGRRFEISLDRLEGLGVFTELETLAEEGDFESARDAVKALAAHLELHDPIVKSYLALKLEAEFGQEVEEK